jgi:autotransporter-associated beta strand protein
MRVPSKLMNTGNNFRISLCVAAITCAGLATAVAATKTWNNTGTDFNADASWTGGKPGLNDIAEFNIPKATDPIVTNTSTQTILGLHFDTVGIGYNITSVPNAFLGIGTSGIVGSNPTGTNTISANLLLNFDQSITQAAGGTLNLTGPMIFGGGTGTTTITIGSTSGNGIINFAPPTVQIGNNISLVTNVNATLGAISPSAVVGEAVTAGITKSGSGTLTLTGNNTYAGSTIINAGTVAASATSGKALGSTSLVTVNSGGTLLTSTANQFGNTTPLTLAGGTFNTGGTSQSLGALSLTSSSTIDLADGSSIVNFGGTSTRTDGTLSITNWSGSLSGAGTDRIIFANPLDPTFLSNINFAGFTPGAMQLPGGEIVPAPEPSTWIGGALALGAIGFSQRRRLSKHLRVITA